MRATESLSCYNACVVGRRLDHILTWWKTNGLLHNLDWFLHGVDSLERCWSLKSSKGLGTILGLSTDEEIGLKLVRFLTLFLMALPAKFQSPLFIEFGKRSPFHWIFSNFTFGKTCNPFFTFSERCRTFPSFPSDRAMFNIRALVLPKLPSSPAFLPFPVSNYFDSNLESWWLWGIVESFPRYR